MPRHVHGLDERCVRDADQYRDPPGNLAARALDQLTPQSVAEARLLTAGSEYEQTMDTAGKDMLDKPFKPAGIEIIAA
jgi:hypothetical protein